jgi:predicted nucleotidyltransferase
MFSLAERSIFLTLAGSHAHGTARDASDIDLRGICVAPLSVRLSLFDGFEQHEGALPEELSAIVAPRLLAHPSTARASHSKIEWLVFDIAKFIRLCIDSNPNALELLFADERDVLHETPLFRRLHAERHRFLTTEVRHTFLGYALSQLRRIKTHRSWLLEPPERKPSRDDFGLPPASGTLSADDRDRIEQSIAQRMRDYGLDDLELPRVTRVALKERVEAGLRDALSTPADALEERLRAVATHALNLPPEVVSTLNAERKYRAAMKHWDSYETWKSQRNPVRAELERAHGYDTKHAMHLVRLMRMGLEALEQGELAVRRSDAAELRAIRDGALPFDRLLDMANGLEHAMERAAETSPLPAAVDRAWADGFLLSLISEADER